MIDETHSGRQSLMARQRVLIGVLAVTLALVLVSCGNPKPPAAASTPASGIFGIVVINDPTMQTARPTPSPLPAGFGLSAERADAYPVAILVKAVDGSRAGKVVAVVHPAHALFRVAVPPGRYVLALKESVGAFPSRVTVTAGQYTRVIFSLLAL